LLCLERLRNGEHFATKRLLASQEGFDSTKFVTEKIFYFIIINVL